MEYTTSTTHTSALLSAKMHLVCAYRMCPLTPSCNFLRVVPSLRDGTRRTVMNAGFSTDKPEAVSASPSSRPSTSVPPTKGSTWLVASIEGEGRIRPPDVSEMMLCILVSLSFAVVHTTALRQALRPANYGLPMQPGRFVCICLQINGGPAA